MMRFFRTFQVLAIFLPGVLFADGYSSDLTAFQDPRGGPDVTICTQNLDGFGRYGDVARRSSGFEREDYKLKIEDLVKRFRRAKCDIVALQEVLGSKIEHAREGMKFLTQAIKDASGRYFDVEIGESNDRLSRIGFLYAKDKASVLGRASYHKVQLPKISENQKPREFSRGPFELQLKVKGSGSEAESKIIKLVTFHFKSKRGSRDDPSRLEWETFRMEMAEALRVVVENRFADSFESASSILVLLGDRNSNYDSASARVLEGRTPLRLYQGTAPCRVSERGIPLCRASASETPVLFSVLTGDPQSTGLPGTYLYNKVYSWLDDILMPAPSLRYARSLYDREGDYDVGIIRGDSFGSDHALAYVRLNW